MDDKIQRSAHAYRDTNRALLLVLLFALGWSFLSLWLSRALPLPFTACVSQVWLHRPCPLCGMTRGLWALLHGQWQRALTLNPFTILAAAGIVMELGYRVCGARSAQAARLVRFRRLDAWLHATLALGYLLYTVVFYALHLGTAV